MSYSVDPNDVVELVNLVNGVEGIRSVSDAAAEVNPPGVWVQVLGYDLDKLAAGHYTLTARLVLVVPDQDTRRARKALTDLLNLVLTVVRPAGRVTPASVVMPNSPAPLPGLLVPVTIHCVPESE